MTTTSIVPVPSADQTIAHIADVVVPRLLRRAAELEEAGLCEVPDISLERRLRAFVDRGYTIEFDKRVDDSRTAYSVAFRQQMFGQSRFVVDEAGDEWIIVAAKLEANVAATGSGSAEGTAACARSMAATLALFCEAFEGTSLDSIYWLRRTAAQRALDEERQAREAQERESKRVAQAAMVSAWLDANRDAVLADVKGMRVGQARQFSAVNQVSVLAAELRDALTTHGFLLGDRRFMIRFYKLQTGGTVRRVK